MRGFTLIEVMVSVAIFGIVALIAYSGLTTIVRAHTALAEQQQAGIALSTAIRRLEKDLEQALPRPVREAYDNPQAAFVGSSLTFSLSTLGVQTSVDGPYFNPLRVSHTFGTEGWQRQSRQVLDAAPNSLTRTRILLPAVERVQLRYLDAQLQSSPQWPPVNSRLPPEALPRALELKFTVRGVGEITRLLLIAEPPLEQRQLVP